MARSISGVVTLEGQPFATKVVAVSVEDTPSVLNTSMSNPDGTYVINVTPWGGEVMVYAVQDYGNAWQPLQLLEIGDVIHPTTPNGYVFRVTTAGSTGSVEPAWPAQTVQVGDGTVQYEGVRLIQPVINGYVTTDLDSAELPPAALFAQGRRGVWYDPSDTSSMFTDLEMTTNVANDGDKVAVMLDKSGSGNHMQQVSEGLRPLFMRGNNLPYLVLTLGRQMDSILPFVESMPFNQDHVIYGCYYAVDAARTSTFTSIEREDDHRFQRTSNSYTFRNASGSVISTPIANLSNQGAYKMIWSTDTSDVNAVQLYSVDISTGLFNTTFGSLSYTTNAPDLEMKMRLGGLSSPLRFHQLLCAVGDVDNIRSNYEAGLDEYFENLVQQSTGN